MGIDRDEQTDLIRDHSRFRARHWLVLAAVVALVAAHGAVLYFVASHTTVSVAVVAGIIGLVAVKHLGLLGPVYALVRRWSGRTHPRRRD